MMEDLEILLTISFKVAIEGVEYDVEEIVEPRRR